MECFSIISLADAKEKGLKHYFTGKKCCKGHLSLRFVSTRQCFKCVKEHSKDWKPRNNEKLRAGNNRRSRKFREENREKWNKYQKEYREKLTNKLRNNKHKQAWKKRNPDQVASYNGRRREIKKTVLTHVEKIQLKMIYKRCQRLNRTLGFIAFHVDHIIPLSKGGKHHPSNLQILSAKDNLRKGANCP